MNLSSEIVQKDVRDKTIGSRLREIINDLSLSQKEFCRRTGILPSTLSGILLSGHNPNSSTLKRIQDHGINVKWLISGQGTKFERDDLASHMPEVRGETSQRTNKEEGQLLLQLRDVAEKLVRLRKGQASMNPKVVDFERAEVLKILTRTVLKLNRIELVALNSVIEGLIEDQDDQESHVSIHEEQRIS